MNFGRQADSGHIRPNAAQQRRPLTVAECGCDSLNALLPIPCLRCDLPVLWLRLGGGHLKRFWIGSVSARIGIAGGESTGPDSLIFGGAFRCCADSWRKS